MASVYHLFENAEDITPQIIKRDEVGQEDRKRLFLAQLKVHNQWLDHLRENEEIRYNAAATDIQRCVRGWIVRWHLPEYYADYIKRIRMRYYNEMATRIQRAWRAYKKRLLEEKNADQSDSKNERSKRKNRRGSLAESVAGSLKDYENFIHITSESEMRLANEAEEQQAKELVLFILFKLHHLLRTATCEGIFSLHGRRELSYIEKLIKAVPMGPYMNKLHQRYKELVKKIEKIPPEPPTFRGWMGRYEILHRKRDRTTEVREPPVFQGINHPKPFSLNSRLPKQPYVRYMLTQEKYGPASEELRVEDTRKRLSYHDFDLNTTKVIPPKEKTPPYHIDFWSRFCEVHMNEMNFA